MHVAWLCCDPVITKIIFIEQLLHETSPMNDQCNIKLFNPFNDEMIK